MASLVIFIALLLTVGCASMLPQSHTNTTTFNSYEEAHAAIETLVPMKSDRANMEKNGFDPTKHPNMTILTHADVVRRYLPSAILKREDLDPGILACLEAKDKCHGFEVIGGKIARARNGGFWADFLNYKRHTETTGWRFNAVVLLVGDLVVYRTWSGQPVVDEKEDTHNPLGPFQDIGPSLVPKP